METPSGCRQGGSGNLGAGVGERGGSSWSDGANAEVLGIVEDKVFVC